MRSKKFDIPTFIVSNKVALFALMLFFFSASFSQTPKPAPTKQETMDWIAGKLKDVLIAPRQFVSYQNGIFKYKNADVIVSVDFNKVTRYETQNFYLYSPQDKFSSVQMFGDKMTTFSNGREPENDFEEKFQDDCKENRDGLIISCKMKYVYSLDGIEGLRYRFISAVDALVQHNVGKKENEAF